MWIQHLKCAISKCILLIVKQVKAGKFVPRRTANDINDDQSAMVEVMTFVTVGQQAIIEPILTKFLPPYIVIKGQLGV